MLDFLYNNTWIIIASVPFLILVTAFFTTTASSTSNKLSSFVISLVGFLIAVLSFLASLGSLFAIAVHAINYAKQTGII